MTLKIPLRLQGIDLRDPEAYDRIDEELGELFWTSNGAVPLAVVLSDDPVPVAAADAVGWARRIAKRMPGVSVAEVHDELVSISDIAARAGVAHEAVRLWTLGKRRASLRPFPAARQVVGTGSGGKTMNLYAWREVLSWIREVLGTDPDDGTSYLTDHEYATLNAQLAAVRAELSEWHPIVVENEKVIADVQQICMQARVSFFVAPSEASDGTGQSPARPMNIPVKLQ